MVNKNIDTNVKSLAVIMDGNRRWARLKGIKDHEGHTEGYRTFLNFLGWVIEAGIPFLTVFAFSSENWRRSKKETDHLQHIIRELSLNERDVFVEKGIKASMIGERGDFSKETRDKINEMEESTKKGNILNLNIALSYGGRREIVSAASKWAQYGKVESVEDFCRFLQTKNTPDPDIVIRTGGERRLSNFLLWQTAYSELFFSDTFWPDFSRREFFEILSVFKERERRFGV